MGFKLDITTFGIEDSDDIFFDLNEENNIESGDYDLILCGQVIEHIWNIDNFVKNIYKVMNSRTHAFIHCPKSNIHHGHTYYSAGYSKEFMLKIFSDHIKLIEYGELGTLSSLYIYTFVKRLDYNKRGNEWKNKLQNVVLIFMEFKL